jgi:hypothetical protein
MRTDWFAFEHRRRQHLIRAGGLDLRLVVERPADLG